MPAEIGWRKPPDLHWESERAKEHRHKRRKHRRRPCDQAPSTPTNLTGEFFRRPGGGRHNRWRAAVKWDEVTTDVLGNAVRIKRYKLVVQYSANGEDWYVDNRYSIPGKLDADDNAMVRKVFPVRAKLAYRYKVVAVARGTDCESEETDWYVLGSPTDAPPAPSDVTIYRRPHGIFVDWDEPVADDDDILDEDIDHYAAQLFVGTEPYAFPDWQACTMAANDVITATGHGYNDGDIVQFRGGALANPLRRGRVYYVRDKTANTFKVATSAGGTAVNLTESGSGYVIKDLYKWKRNIRRTQFRFNVDDVALDEDQKFFARVLSVSDDNTKSVWIPATKSGNSDPEATPEGRTPKYVRRVFEFTVIGALEEKVYIPPTRVDDDYRVRRVTGIAETAGSGGASKVDILVKSGTGGWESMFDNNANDMLTFSAGDPDGSTKAMTIKDLVRGDRMKVKGYSVSGTPPKDLTIQVIADRVG